MPKIPSTSQYNTSDVVFLHILVSSYNSTYTFPQILTSKPSANLTLTAELYFVSNPHLLQVARDKKLRDAPLSMRIS